MVAQIKLAGAVMRGAHHVCAFFNDEDEQYRVLMPFIREGVLQGHRVVHIVSVEDRERRLARLAEDPEVAAAIDAGRVEVRAWREVVQRPGDVENTLGLIRRILEEGKSRGFPVTRLIGDMAWTLEGLSGPRDILRFEAGFDELHVGYEDPAVCAHDTRRFSGGLLIDLIRTHPVVLIGGVLHENPFYVEPEEFLRELG